MTSGAETEQRTFAVAGMRCASCAARVEKALGTTPGARLLRGWAFPSGVGRALAVVAQIAGQANAEHRAVGAAGGSAAP